MTLSVRVSLSINASESPFFLAFSISTALAFFISSACKISASAEQISAEFIASSAISLSVAAAFFAFFPIMFKSVIGITPV